MDCKKLCLSVFLVPFATSSNNNADVRIQELQKDQFEKELELSQMSKMIMEKAEFLDSIKSKGDAIYASIAHKLNEKEKKEFKNEIAVFEDRFNEALEGKNDVKEVFMKEFLNGDRDINNEYDRMKFFVMIYSVEDVFLKKLFKCYEKSLQELFQINNKLKELQKQI